MTNDATLLHFLIELRRRLIHCVLLLLILFCGLIYFANQLYTLLALPLLKFLPHHQGLIAINIAAPLFVPYELTFVSSIFLGVPFFLYQLWRFIAPALYKKEKRLLWPLLFGSTFLFYGGMSFAYFVVLPILFRLLTHTAPIGVMVSPDMTEYLNFTLKFLFIFGVIFEVPIIIIFLIWSGIVTRVQLQKFRPYMIVGAFIVGMLLAPPDVLSQTLVAIPLCVLFEMGMLFSLFFRKC